MSMSWFKLDDGFWSHPKVLQAGNEAIGLLVRCGSYCARYLTDGYVPADFVNLYGSPDLAEKLVTAGLFHSVEGGWQIHDYLEYNPTKNDVSAMRQRHASAQKRYMDRTRRTTDRSVDPSVILPRPDPSRKDGSGLRPSPSLPAHAAFARGGNAAPARPEWCGHCDPATRLFEIDGRAVRCARCHPLTQEPA